MNLSKVSKTLAFLSALLLVAACSPLSESSFVDMEAINQLQIKNLSHPERATFASGQPGREELRALSQAGVKHVINLRPVQELDWNEGEFVQSLGMEYYSIPVKGAAGITVENAASLSEVLKGIGGEPALVHCSSGNRVGALIALGAGALKGANVDEAVNIGKRWGLTRLEPVVREKLAP